MAKKSIKINAILNAVRLVMGMLFQLITYPYVTRVLQAEYLGKVTYSQSIVSYFSLIAALGVGTYAVREGSKYRANKERIEQFASEVFTSNIITTLISYLLLMAVLFAVPKFHTYIPLIAVLSMSIIFTTIGVDWVNVIFEDFLVITVRSIAIQIINMFLIFLLVKDTSDYYIYAVLTISSSMIICVWNFFYCRKYIHIHIIRTCNFFKHVKLMVVFFANSLAITVYCNADSTMIGWIIGDSCVGIYAVAVKVYSIVKGLLASVYTVCIPRLSNYYSKEDYKSFQSLIEKVISGLFVISLPSMVGLIMLAKPIIILLAGAGYESAIVTLRILSIALIFAVVGGVFSNCVNIPMGKERVSLLATIIAAVINVGLNVIVIPIWKHNGAAVTTVIAELSVLVICFIYNSEIRKLISWNKIIKSAVQAIVGSVGVALACLVVQKNSNSQIVCCVVSFGLSIIMYFLIMLALNNELVFDTAYRIRLQIKKMKNR